MPQIARVESDAVAPPAHHHPFPSRWLVDSEQGLVYGRGGMARNALPELLQAEEVIAVWTTGIGKGRAHWVYQLAGRC